MKVVRDTEGNRKHQPHLERGVVAYGRKTPSEMACLPKEKVRAPSIPSYSSVREAERLKH